MRKHDTIEHHYRTNYQDLVKFARKRVGEYSLPLAEEAVQEAFCKAIKYFRAYNPNEDFSKWFGRILVNVINDIKRQERNAAFPPSTRGKSVHFDGSVEFTKEVIDELQRQKPRNLDILNMYFFYDYKSREIGEFMNISHDVVRDVIRTFRKRVRSV